MKPLVSIVIVIWNGVADTLECLRSLSKDTYPNKEIIVVDNGSTDDSAARIREEGFNVTLLSCPLNLGFTGGNNVGLSEALRRGAKYAFLLNNDTTVDPGALSILVETAEGLPDAGVLSPAVYYHDTPREVWFSGATLCLARGEALHSNLPAGGTGPGVFPTAGIGHGAFPSPWVSGCAMLARMDAVRQVGGFDDRFFLTWEDVDWCCRMRMARWEVLVVSAACIYHKCGRSGARLTGVHRYYAVRNSLLLASKHAGYLYVSALAFILGRHCRGSLAGPKLERRQNLATVLEGFKDHLLGRYGRRPLRNMHINVKVPPSSVKPVEIEASECVSYR